jgi:ornithine carrier protein
MFSGQMAWLASLPMDMVKSIMQTSEKNLTTMEVTRQIYNSPTGIKTFYRGVGITVLRAFPSNAALFLGYEMSKSILSSGSTVKQ